MTVRSFRELKAREEPITVLTCYDYLFAQILEEEGVDMILVGDSLGQVVMGYESTLPVTVNDMVHHAKAVRRGAPRSFTVVDLPFLSYQASDAEALHSAGRILKETGAHAVKLEGGNEDTCRTIERLVRAGIPVMGHLGFVPQSVHMFGGSLVQGRDPEGANDLLDRSRALEEAGCFSIVLELVEGSVAGNVTRALSIPTIGIGAGAECDGQVLVLPDALGLNPGFNPRFLKRFAELADLSRRGVRSYIAEVKGRTFPGPEHTFGPEA